MQIPALYQLLIRFSYKPNVSYRGSAGDIGERCAPDARDRSAADIGHFHFLQFGSLCSASF